MKHWGTWLSLVKHIVLNTNCLSCPDNRLNEGNIKIIGRILNVAKDQWSLMLMLPAGSGIR